ncbi:L-histidine N(alpha)-methyltransferase [Kordiimonas aquimaris]|uniref:L-histidine N(alpha)-methyltransferase n=1 Tax=Kordiimonas aquimaris TaxID=707591 RepID=UPI0021CEF2A4|nr:L-histidine N(alpha)-methyltransferase [Kordiimonas aquimaris]
MYGENIDTATPTGKHNTTASTFAESVLAGLALPQKTLPCYWLYDTRGSELFEQITKLPEYYPTRTEVGILQTNIGEICEAIGPGASVVEFGAGAGTKTRLLLSALVTPQNYIPIDISADFLESAMTHLAADYPTINITPIVADFTSPEALVKATLPGNNRLGFFPGSTIGNLSDIEIADFLSGAKKGLGTDAQFLIGIDLVKSTDVLIPAYDDAAGVTAAFNLNLLQRINREISGCFDLDNFKHEARWNQSDSRIEMHLVSQIEQAVRVGNQTFSFRKGETIHTENSRKFTLKRFEALAQNNGWRLKQTWIDENDYFCLALLG